MWSSIRASRRLRWAVPAGVVAVTGAVAAAFAVPAAQAGPALPPRTPAQLLAAVAGRTAPLPAFTGTVVETASLGLPSLPDVGDPTSLQSLVTGSHTVRVWYADPQHFRLAIPGQLSETDLIRNGQDLWTWSSVHNTATHARLQPPDAAREPVAAARAPLTPQQAADQIIAAVGPTTSVRIASNVTVAGQPSYELVLAPKDSRSLIGQVRIAVDAHQRVPLRVQIFARGALNAPAFQTGFTSISYTRPAAANFAFRPPPGSHVVQGSPVGIPLPAAVAGRSAHTVVGQGWLAVAVLPAGPAAIGPAAARMAVPAGSPPKGAKVRLFRVAPGMVCPPQSGAKVPAVRAGPGPVCSLPGGATRRVVRVGSPLAGPTPGGTPPQALPLPAGGVLSALARGAVPVHGAWGSGRLLRTTLLSVLVTSDGRMLVGAVEPQVLYAAAAQTAPHGGQAGR